MRELIYNQSSVVIVLLIYACLQLAKFFGTSCGRRHQKKTNIEGLKSQIATVLSSILGLLALLLGFTFSLSLQRFDDRSNAVVGEAAAIGSAYNAVDLIPAAMRDEARAQIRAYLSERIEEARVDLSHATRRQELLVRMAQTQSRLWEIAVKALQADPNAATSGYFVRCVDELSNKSDYENASYDRHVPELVLLLLFCTLVIGSAVLGYSAGLSGHRVTLPGQIMVVLMVLVVFIILDLDRPRRGIIKVDQGPLLNLQHTINAPAAESNPAR